MKKLRLTFYVPCCHEGKAEMTANPPPFPPKMFSLGTVDFLWGWGGAGGI